MTLQAETRHGSLVASWRPMSRSVLLGLPGWAIGPAYLVCYSALDWASYVAPYKSFNITPWNPGVGLSFAFVLLFGQRFLPLIALAPFASSFAVLGRGADPRLELAAAMIIGGGYSLGLMWLIRPRTRFDATLASMRDLALLVGAAFASSAVVALLFTAMLVAAGYVPVTDGLVVLRRLWIGDAIGITVVTPLVLVVATSGTLPRPGLESLGMLIAVVAALFAVFAPSPISHLHLFYLLFLPVIWIGLRHGLEGVAIGLALTQVGLIVGVLLTNRAGVEVTALQMLMMVLSLTGLAIGSVVSERRRIEYQLRLNQEAVARILLVGTMGELASAIAHEVNQPLTAILNYTRVIKRHIETGSVDRATALEAARKSIAQVERTSELIRSVRELIRLGRSEIGPVAPQRIVRESLDLLEHVIQRGAASVDVELARDLPPIMADVMQLEQALMNLVLNAVEAFEERGLGERRISIRVRPDGARVEFVVQDTGPGFPAEFNVARDGPQGSTKAHGLGLGLSLTRSIIEAHGGTLTLERGNPGALARFSIPAAAESSHD